MLFLLEFAVLFAHLSKSLFRAALVLLGLQPSAVTGAHGNIKGESLHPQYWSSWQDRLGIIRKIIREFTLVNMIFVSGTF